MPRTATSSATTRLVGQLGHPPELEAPVLDVLGERAQRRDLGPGEAGRRPQRLRVVGEDLARRGRPAAEARLEPPVDRGGRPDGELLAGDGAHERAVELLRAPAGVGPGRQRAAVGVDQPRHDRVGGAQVVVGIRRAAHGAGR